MAAGQYAHRTIYDSPRLTPAQIEAYIADAAMQAGLTVEDFKRTTTYKREYLAQRVTDAESAIVPEWADAADDLVVEHPLPPIYRPIVVADLGFKRDLTGGVGGYYDFAKKKLVVEDEFALRHASTAKVADAFRKLETERFPNVHVERYLDDPGRMAADLWEMHRVSASPIANKNRDADRENARSWVSHRRVLINPRCKSLIRQLHQGVFSSNGVEWERDEVDGHQDVLAAFVYFCRLVDTRNPYPPGFGFVDPQNQAWAHGVPKKPENVGRKLMQFTSTGRLLARGTRR
jgi:hypothetical protein